MLPAPTKILLATTPVDMRKSYQGLSVLAQTVLEHDPFSATAFVFTNKKRDILKILYWHINGFCLVQKRLEEGRFTTAISSTRLSRELTLYQLQGLIQGIDWENIPTPNSLTYTYL